MKKIDNVLKLLISLIGYITLFVASIFSLVNNIKEKEVILTEIILILYIISLIFILINLIYHFKKFYTYRSCILAGGCFWCMSKPYYEYQGIKKVFSGYSGGVEKNPTYEDVKNQKTSHRECIKLIYDKNIISYKEILDIYFETIDPYDDGGQFIDRGESYTTALFYNNQKMKRKILDYISEFEKKQNKKVAVKVLKETKFYIAEEYHQDYCIKYPKLMEKELKESGRIK